MATKDARPTCLPLASLYRIAMGFLAFPDRRRAPLTCRIFFPPALILKRRNSR